MDLNSILSVDFESVNGTVVSFDSVSKVLNNTAEFYKTERKTTAKAITAKFAQLYAEEAGISYESVQAVATAQDITLTDENPINVNSHDKLTNEQVSCYVLLLNTPQAEIAEQKLIEEYFMHLKYKSITQAGVSSIVSNGLVEMEELEDEAVIAVTDKIKNKKSMLIKYVMDGHSVMNKLVMIGKTAIQDALTKSDKYIDHYGQSIYERKAIGKIAEAKANNDTPDIDQISKDCYLAKNKIKELVDTDAVCVSSQSYEEIVSAMTGDQIDNKKIETGPIDSSSVDYHYDNLAARRQLGDMIASGISYLTPLHASIFYDHVLKGETFRIIADKYGIKTTKAQKMYQEACEKAGMTLEFRFKLNYDDAMAMAQ